MPIITTGPMRLGRDAEVRYLPSGQAVVTLSLAFNYGKRGDDNKRPTQWVEAGFWGDYAVKTAPHLLKGTLICAVLEDMHTEEFTRSDKSTGHKLAARMQSFDFAGQRESGQASAPAGTAPRQAPRQAPPPRPASGFDDMDDDIPF
jgi:single-strand DNA-binding protein